MNPCQFLELFKAPRSVGMTGGALGVISATPGEWTNASRPGTIHVMEAALSDWLDSALSGIVLRAWRLHLETPGVQASVPMLRGVWGASLKALSEPPYQRLFGDGEVGTPRYVLRPAPPEVRPSPAVEFLLFGPPDRRDDDIVWAAWDHAARSGLGPQRRPFVLSEVRPLVWDGTPLSPNRSQPGFSLCPLPWPPGDPSSACRLEFPAPLRLIYGGRLVEQPTLADVTIAALRRVRSLTPTPVDALWSDRHSWLNAARQIRCELWQGERLDLVRYSGSQKRELELRGVCGSLLLPEGPGPLAALLAASTWLHLGKGTVMGLGQLRITTAPASS